MSQIHQLHEHQQNYSSVKASRSRGRNGHNSSTTGDCGCGFSQTAHSPEADVSLPRRTGEGLQSTTGRGQAERHREVTHTAPSLPQCDEDAAAAGRGAPEVAAHGPPSPEPLLAVPETPAFPHRRRTRFHRCRGLRLTLQSTAGVTEDWLHARRIGMPCSVLLGLSSQTGGASSVTTGRSRASVLPS